MSTPGVATFFGDGKESLDGSCITTFERALQLLQVVDEYTQRTRQRRAVRQRDVAPHLGRTGGNTRRIAEAIRAKHRLLRRQVRMENLVREFRRDNVWKVTRPCHEFVMQLRRELHNPSAERPPKLFHLLDGFGVRIRRRREDTHRIAKQIDSRGENTRFLGPGHRMNSDKMSTGARNEWNQFRDNARLDAANVTQDGTALQGRQQSLGNFFHLGEWRAKDDKVRVSHRFQQIKRGEVVQARSRTLNDGGFAPHIASHDDGKFALANSQGQRTAQQAHTDQSNFAKLHSTTIAEL